MILRFYQTMSKSIINQVTFYLNLPNLYDISEYEMILLSVHKFHK